MQSLTLVVRKIETTFLFDSEALQFHLIIALNKNPGVRPIWIGEVLHHLIVNSILLEAAGCSQLYAGQWWGCEAAIHAIREIFMADDVLVMDAFNSLNRRTAVLTIFHLCPPLATTLTNTYRNAAALFIDGNTL